MFLLIFNQNIFLASLLILHTQNNHYGIYNLCHCSFNKSNSESILTKYAGVGLSTIEI